MLSTKYRVRLTDICCRIISDDSVTIEERVWMNKLCEHNAYNIFTQSKTYTWEDVFEE